MAKAITGKLALKGFVVMETYDVQMDIPPELQAAFDKDPEKHIRAFLRKSGQKVNSVQVMSSSKGAAAATVTRRARRNHWFHIVYPPNERSGWICA